jgi:hypothetical protein
MKQSDWDDIVEESLRSDEMFEEGLDPIQIATARIEQGNLYKLLIEQDIFDGVNASPDVLNKVRSEIAQFATMRLEILLGLKKVERKQKEASGLQLEPEDILLLKALLEKVKHKEAPSITTGELRGTEKTATETPKLKPIQDSRVSTKKPIKEESLEALETKRAMDNKTVLTRPESLSQNGSADNVSKQTSELQQARLSISALKKERDLILKNVQQKDNEWTEEERRRFREISDAIDDLSRPRGHPSFYTPKPGINEENAISTARAELLSRNLGEILKTNRERG